MYKIKTDGHPNSLGRMGGFLLCPLLPSTLPTPKPGTEEPLRVLLSLVPPTSKPIHLSLTGGDTILSMKSSFLISMSVCLESIPAIQGELNVRHVWRMAGVSFFFFQANTFGFAQLLHLFLGCSRTCRTPWSQWTPWKFGEYCKESSMSVWVVNQQRLPLSISSFPSTQSCGQHCQQCTDEGYPDGTLITQGSGQCVGCLGCR